MRKPTRVSKLIPVSFPETLMHRVFAIDRRTGEEGACVFEQLVSWGEMKEYALSNGELNSKLMKFEDVLRSGRSISWD